MRRPAWASLAAARDGLARYHWKRSITGARDVPGRVAARHNTGWQPVIGLIADVAAVARTSSVRTI
jgi:hypothetical protein